MSRSRRTQSEELFEKYLSGLNYQFKYEETICGKNPDYCVYDNGQLLCICEVKQIERSGCDVTQIDGSVPSSFEILDTTKHLKRKLDEAYKQLPRNADVPCVIVVALIGSDPIDEDDVIGAMLGDRTIKSISNTRIDTYWNSKRAKMRSNQLTRVSAISIIKFFHPVQIDTYHNPYAKTKFSESVFKGPNSKNIYPQPQKRILKKSD